MPSSRKSAITALATALGAAQVFAQAGAEGKGGVKKDAPKKDPKKPGKGADIEIKKKGGDEPLDLPFPKGQPQQGVKIPIYDTDGKMRMRFEIGAGTWVDDENIKMTKLRIETFKEDGTRDMDMDLPDAVLNQRTKDLTSKIAATVKRDDFEIAGNSLTYNIETGAGTFGGGVKMIIYNLQEEAGAKPREKKTSIELKPAPNEKENPK